MRVLLVHNRYRSRFPSGENAVVEDEAALLTQHGCEVDVLSVESDDIESWSSTQKLALPARVVWSREGARLVSAAIRSTAPDVVHVHNTFPLLSPAVLRSAKATGVPVVITLHNFRPLCASGMFLRHGQVCETCLTARSSLPAIVHGCYRDSRLTSIPVAAMIAVHRRARTWTDYVDRAICPTNFSRDKFIAAGWPAKKLVTKYNTAMAPAEPRRGAGAGFVVLSRLTPEKGIDSLLSAWRDAALGGAEQLTIIGSGEDEARLREIAANIKNVRFAGQLPRDEALRRVAQARALLVPSRWYEVFPRTIAEAYALGVPVIASRIGALAEIVEDGRTGLLTGVDAPKELASALRAVASDDPLAERLGRGAHTAYLDRYSPQASTDALIAIYRELAPELAEGAVAR